jgi:hypothetical protein
VRRELPAFRGDWRFGRERIEAWLKSSNHAAKADPSGSDYRSLRVIRGCPLPYTAAAATREVRDEMHGLTHLGPTAPDDAAQQWLAMINFDRRAAYRVGKSA